MRFQKVIAMIFLVVFAGVIFSGCGSKPNQGSATNAPDTEDKFKVAFLYASKVGDFGWYYQHDVARKALEKELSYVETKALEDVTTGAQAERVMRQLAQDGYDVIIGASADYEADALKVAKDFPETKFLVCNGSKVQEPNVEPFFPRAYQQWYVFGQLAGYMTETNVLGMIGAIVVPSNVQFQNAFELGAKSVNPEAKLKLIFLNTFYDPAAEKDAALSLIDAGADVIAQNTNSPAHVQAAEEKGVMAISMWNDMSEYGPNSYLTGDIYDWTQYYIPTIQKIHDGSWTPSVRFADISEGWIKMAAYGPKVPQDVQDKINAQIDKMKNGELDPDFFWSGPIYDNTGKLRVPEGSKLNDDDLVAMDWWVDGIETAMTKK